MINKNELRIGNWVYDGNNELTQVHSIVDGAINYELDYGNLWTNQECYFENINPIQMDEEWLLKFGFDRINHYYCMNDSSMNYHYELKGDKDFMLFFDGRCFAINESKISHRPKFAHNKYVHKLQNLWDSVTGEELTLSVT